MEYLPRLEEAPGWRLLGDPLVVPGKALQGYIGRQSLRLGEYEVIDATIGEYQSTAGDRRATVEIYRFSDFVKAFGAWSSGRKAVLQHLPIENDAYLSPHSIHLWRGPFYVRIAGDLSPAPEPMVALARAVSEKMPAAPGRPAVFQFLPATSRVPHSEVFSAGPVFGQPYLAGGFTAEFDIGGQRLEGMILPAPSKQVAAEVLNRYRAFFAANGRLLDPVPNLGEDNFTGEDRFLGRTAAFRLDRFVVAFRGFGERQQLVDLAIATNQTVLNSIRLQLQAAERDARAAAAAARPPNRIPARPAPVAQPQSPEQSTPIEAGPPATATTGTAPSP